MPKWVPAPERPRPQLCSSVCTAVPQAAWRWQHRHHRRSEPAEFRGVVTCGLAVTLVDSCGKAEGPSAALVTAAQEPAPLSPADGEPRGSPRRGGAAGAPREGGWGGAPTTRHRPRRPEPRWSPRSPHATCDIGQVASAFCCEADAAGRPHGAPPGLGLWSRQTGEARWTRGQRGPRNRPNCPVLERHPARAPGWPRPAALRGRQAQMLGQRRLQRGPPSDRDSDLHNGQLTPCISRISKGETSDPPDTLVEKVPLFLLEFLLRKPKQHLYLSGPALRTA